MSHKKTVVRKVSGVIAGCVLALSAVTSSCYAMSFDLAKSYANSVYSNTDLSKTSGISRNDFIDYCKTMQNDKGGFYSRNAAYIWDVCQEYGVNEFLFIGVSAQEGGWATQGPSYNYYGTIGLRYSSEQDGIRSWVSFIKKAYLTPGGRYYNGSTIRGIGKYYCPSGDWPWEILGRIQDSARRK